MIDPDTGVLSFDQPPVLVNPSITRDQFLAASWAKGATDWVVNEPWHSWKLAGEYVSHSMPFLVMPFFSGNNLERVELCNADAKFGTSWDDYSIEREMNRKASHEQWLAATVGSRRLFDWGSIWSGYDERAGNSGIVIRYNSRP